MGQPVEKVVVDPVGEPIQPENKARTLLKRRIWPPEPGAEEGAKEFFNRLGWNRKFS
jgi:hypothetical protein